jgi:hypothetical protein
MRKFALMIVAVVFTLSAQAAEGYRFHIRATDGRTALQSNPDFEKLHVSAEQLEQAANDRVVVLNDTEGTHWRWLMLTWRENDPKTEHALSTRGVTPKSADLAISAGSPGHLRLRCLQEACAVRVDHDAQPETSFSLKRGETSPDVPLDSTVTLAFPAR